MLECAGAAEESWCKEEGEIARRLCIAEYKEYLERCSGQTRLDERRVALSY